jgi:hypothetical protein
MLRSTRLDDVVRGLLRDARRRPSRLAGAALITADELSQNLSAVELRCHAQESASRQIVSGPWTLGSLSLGGFQVGSRLSDRSPQFQ